MTTSEQLYDAAFSGHPLNVREECESPQVSGAALAEVLAVQPGMRPLVRLHIRDAEINDTFDFSGLLARCPVVLERCTFSERLLLRDARFPGLRLPGSVLIAGLDGVDLVVDATLGLNDSFRAEASVVLDRARVGGSLDCTGARFRSKDTEGKLALSAKGATIGGDLLLTRGFAARGEVRLAQAKISGELECSDSDFSNPCATALFADNVRVAGRVACGQGFRATGGVDFRRAEIGSQFRLEGACEASGVSGIDDEFAWNLEAARITRAVVFTPAKPMPGAVNMTNATFGYLRDNDNAWTGGYELSGLVFGDVISSDEQDAQRAASPGVGRRARPTEGAGRLLWWRPDRVVDKRLAWLEGNAGGYQPALYDQLAEDYRRAGHERRCRSVLIAKQRRRRKDLPSPARAWSKLEDILLGYGYRSWQALFVVVLLLAAGTAFFAATHKDITPPPGQSRPPAWPLIYTIDLLVPLAQVGQHETFTPRHFGAVVATALTVSGWLLLTAILAGLTGFIRRLD